MAGYMLMCESLYIITILVKFLKSPVEKLVQYILPSTFSCLISAAYL